MALAPAPPKYFRGAPLTSTWPSSTPGKISGATYTHPITHDEYHIARIKPAGIFSVSVHNLALPYEQSPRSVEDLRDNEYPAFAAAQDLFAIPN